MNANFFTIILLPCMMRLLGKGIGDADSRIKKPATFQHPKLACPRENILFNIAHCIADISVENITKHRSVTYTLRVFPIDKALQTVLNILAGTRSFLAGDDGVQSLGFKAHVNVLFLK
ncbi:MAG TPA: hypothetical protein DIT97_31740 [Gimesia maris]|uniref:Uncharacterized protein n=1 Tax=Gimesia maris TaxID=122 RepID=A0A3D3RGY3_9PLAN|nr:hypothetical protein [Gimesia maris]